MNSCPKIYATIIVTLLAMVIGCTGPVGPQGQMGNDGAVGPQGPSGLPGKDGATGPQGSAGLPGNKGEVGLQGPMGNTGAIGPEGPRGFDGPAGGPEGPRGLQGPQGDTGPTGPQGERGLPGALTSPASYLPVPVPVTLSEIGQKASAFFDLDAGLVIFKLTHDGRSNFIVWLFDAEGQRVELLVNDVGQFDGSTAIGINQRGVHLLDVSADGNWTVSIEQP